MPGVITKTKHGSTRARQQPFRGRPLAAAFFERDPLTVATELVGCWLVATSGRDMVGGPIVETEAYDEHDPASHSYGGLRPRNTVMFGPPGYLYVYKIYGMHWCMNISTGPRGFGAAVLLRAIAPLLGSDTMHARRGPRISERDLARGPGRLCAALGVDDALQGHRVNRAPLSVYAPHAPVSSIRRTPRVGISKNKDLRWRCVLRDSPWSSGPAKWR